VAIHAQVRGRAKNAGDCPEPLEMRGRVALFINPTEGKFLDAPMLSQRTGYLSETGKHRLQPGSNQSPRQIPCYIAGNLAGNFLKKASEGRFSHLKRGQDQSLMSEFPAQRSREFFCWSREFSRGSREFCAWMDPTLRARDDVCLPFDSYRIRLASRSRPTARLGNHEHEMVDDERHDALRKTGIAPASVF
jgi:hypothetical protein